MNFTLLSPARAATKEREGKAATVVEVECDGSIRERQPNERIHLAKDLNRLCEGCFIEVRHFVCWTDSADLHSRHPARCSS